MAKCMPKRVVLDLQEVGRFLNLLKDRGQASVGALAEDNRVERGDEARDGCQWR